MPDEATCSSRALCAELVSFAVSTRLAHRDQNLARPAERVAPMRDEHVVHHQHITLLPGERYCLLPVSFTNLFDCFIVNRRSITVISVIGQVVEAKLTQKHLPDCRIETRDVPERDVIEPDPLTGLRVLPDCRPHLPCLQVAILFPDTLDARATAVVFHFLLSGNAERGLPRQAQVFTEIAHEHPALFVKPLSDLWVNAIVNSTNVGNRSLTTAGRRDHAEEEDLHRPGDHVGELVV